MNKGSRIYVAGHRGLVGSAIVRKLKTEGYSNLITVSSSEVDLARQSEVEAFFEREKPEYVFLAAAKVGGILANSNFPADFIKDNLLIQTNVIDSAYKSEVNKLLFLGSSCIYPKLAPQPMKEEYLLTAPLEETNESYSIAKIAGIKMCQAYRRQYNFNAISIMPTNLYGPGDNFDLKTSHALPALIRKFHEAKVRGDKEVVVWGSGDPMREWLHVDDLADASLFLIDNYDSGDVINIGVGKDISMMELAGIIKGLVGYKGVITLDRTKPDGMPKKLLDVSRLNKLGWQAKISLLEGIEGTYQWYLEQESNN